MALDMIHILNGDSLKEMLQQAKMEGEFIICRECLIEGPVQAADLADFWLMRAKYLDKTYDEPLSGYSLMVKKEFEKIQTLSPDAEVNLWFENDLFCQVNLWFILSLIAQLPQQPTLYRIFPIVKEQQKEWWGFGGLDNEDLYQSHIQKVQLTESDILIGNQLWKAYQQSDFEALTRLALYNSLAFRYLPEVVQAHIERFSATGYGRPERVLHEIIQTKSKDFNEVFAEFFKQQGIYGFGDSQVKQLYDKLLN
jgi:hypothetical protein